MLYQLPEKSFPALGRRVLPLLIWMAIIFFMSHQNGQDSARMSGFFGQLLRQWIEALGGEYTPELRTVLSGLVRKTAHAMEYGILFILVFRLLTVYKVPAYNSSWGFCLAHALSDEFHQSFVPGRVASWADVGIDMIGATLACLLILHRIIYFAGTSLDLGRSAMK